MSSRDTTAGWSKVNRSTLVGGATGCCGIARTAQGQCDVLSHESRSTEQSDSLAPERQPQHAGRVSGSPQHAAAASPEA